MESSLKQKALFIIVLFCLLNQTGCANSLCSNTELIRLSSPDGKLEAVSFTRDCGATTKKSKQLSIVKYGERVGNSKGNTYISYDSFDLSWNNNRELIITSTSDDIFKQAKRVKGVTISYLTPKE